MSNKKHFGNTFQGGLNLCLIFQMMADNLLFLFCSHQRFRSFSPRVVSDSSCLLISFATPGSHDQGMRELSRVKGLPVPMLTGEKLMGVFSLLVLQSSAFIRMGTGYLDDPPGTCRNRITCPRRKKKLWNHFACSVAAVPALSSLYILEKLAVNYKPFCHTWLEYDGLNCLILLYLHEKPYNINL